LECLKAASAMKPFDVALAKNLALAWHNRRAADQALPLLRRIVKLDPNDVEARLLLEPLQSGRRIPDAASDLPLSKAFLEGRLDVRYRYVFRAVADDLAGRINDYALEMIRHGLIRDAAGWLKAFLENYENSPTIYYNLGQLENSLGFNAAALEYALKAVELKSDYREAYDLAANVLFKIGDFEGATQYYEESVRRDPKDPVGYYNLGCAFSESGDFKKAEKNWLSAVRLEGALPAGFGARDSGNKESLAVSVDVKVEPISASACQSLGLLYVKQKRNDEALAFFLRAAELNPRSPQAFLEAGKLYKEKGESAKAGEFFNRYRALGGDEAKVKEILKK
jgi:tetratricopeptide (TPR) repeat protein